MKAVLFCRVSSKEQEETGYSLPSQEKLLKDYCQSKGFEIEKIFSLSESAGGSKQRKMFLEMLEYVRKTKIKNLIVEKTDRLTRNMRDAVAVNSWIEDDEEKQVHFVKENFVLHKNSKSNDKFIWGIKVTTAQYYLDNLSEEVKKGQKEKLRQGWLPTRAPYGYKTIGDKGRKIHVLDEEVAPIIRKMFEMYASGDYSLNKLGNEVYEMGLRSINGVKLQKSRLHRLLRDPFYIGINTWHGQQTKGNQEPLIDKEIFDIVQKVLSGKCTPKYSKHDYLFKGLFECRECGGTITWERQKEIVYGHCNHYRKCTVKQWSKEKKINGKIIKELGKLKIKNERLLNWLGRALKESNQAESDFYISSTKELEKQREILKRRLDAIYIDKIDEKISVGYYDQKFKEFSEDLENIDAKIAKHTKAVNAGQNRRIILFEIAQGGKDKYKKGEIKDRRELMGMAFKSMKLEGVKVYLELEEDFDLIKSLAKETNSSKLGKYIDNGDKIFEQYDLKKASEYFATLDPRCSALLPLASALLNCHTNLNDVDFITLDQFQLFWSEINLTQQYLTAGC